MVNYDNSDKAYELYKSSFNEKDISIKISLLEQSLELEYDFDTYIQLIIAKTNDAKELEKKLREEIAKERKRLEKEDRITEEDIGSFYGLVETRPYMRTRYELLLLLLREKKYKEAMKEGEDLLELSENDNLGVRYPLAHLYCYLDEGKKLKKLTKNELSILMTLPLITYYYKNKQFNEAIKKVKLLQKHKIDIVEWAKELKKTYNSGKLFKFESEYYCRNSLLEFLSSIVGGSYVYEELPDFMNWLSEIK